MRRVLRIRRKASVLVGELVADSGGEVRFLPDAGGAALVPRGIPVECVGNGTVVAVSVPAYTGVPAKAPIWVEFASDLGLRTRPGFLLDYAVLRYGFEDTMPEAVTASVATVGLDDGDRPDLTDIPFVTIDSSRTNDFDDAVYASRNCDGWDVRIAISDVSWYVQEGTVVDQWAAAQGTSVYLPGRVLPMLPVELSQGVCALSPHENKRAVVLTIQLDWAGRVTSHHFGRAWVKSVARLTYADVSQFLAESPGTGPVDSLSQREAGPSVRALLDVHLVLAALRAQRGWLDYGEADAVLTPGGVPEAPAIKFEQRTIAHRVVETLMLLANQLAAERLVSRYGFGLLRQQPSPTPDKWYALQLLARERGYSLPEVPSMLAITEWVHGQPLDQQDAMSWAVRLSMRSASYVLTAAGTPGQAGHFSLALPLYTHFTSPIRRYADLLTHRLLLAPQGATLSAEHHATLAVQVAWCTNRAQASREAELFVWDALKRSWFTHEVAHTQVLRARITQAKPPPIFSHGEV